MATYQDHADAPKLCNKRHDVRDIARCTEPAGHDRASKTEARAARSTVPASNILRSLRTRHSERSVNGGHTTHKWAFLEELHVGAGFNQQRIDAWAMGLWPSTRHRLIAYEVKVTRSDFMAEMAKPWKRLAALERSNEFYFAAPAGLIKVEELPTDSGLIEIGPRGGTKIVVPAPWREVDSLPLSFVACVARRAVRAA